MFGYKEPISYISAGGKIIKNFNFYNEDDSYLVNDINLIQLLNVFVVWMLDKIIMNLYIYFFFKFHILEQYLF